MGHASVRGGPADADELPGVGQGEAGTVAAGAGIRGFRQHGRAHSGLAEGAGPPAPAVGTRPRAPSGAAVAAPLGAPCALGAQGPARRGPRGGGCPARVSTAGGEGGPLHGLGRGFPLERGAGLQPGEPPLCGGLPRSASGALPVSRARDSDRRRVGVQGRLRAGLPGGGDRALGAAPQAPGAQRRGGAGPRPPARRVLRR